MFECDAPSVMPLVYIIHSHVTLALLNVRSIVAADFELLSAVRHGYPQLSCYQSRPCGT